MPVTHRKAVIRQVTNALRKTFDTDYPDEMFRDIYLGPNFQMAREKYPAIYVAYQENDIRQIGLGHLLDVIDDQGMDRVVQQAVARGAIQFTVMALTPLERDTLMDYLADLLLFSRKDDSVSKNVFWREIHDAGYIWLTLNNEHLTPGGISSQAAPWQSENDLLFTGSYMVQSTAEFFSDMDTSTLVPVTKVKVYPYREDQPVPTGTNDDAEWN
jgi:hypothetical protein